MAKTYFVKTRNWNSSQLIKKLLDLSLKAGAACWPDEDYQGDDKKYFFETNSLLAGLLVLAYWLILSHWSGDWTYISKYNLAPDAAYKIFYL